MNGKGSKPRPLSVSAEQYGSNWDHTFKGSPFHPTTKTAYACGHCGTPMKLCKCCNASRNSNSFYHCPNCQPELCDHD